MGKTYKDNRRVHGSEVQERKRWRGKEPAKIDPPCFTPTIYDPKALGGGYGKRSGECGYTAAELVFVLTALFGLAMFIGVVCVIIHFIAKFW